MGTAASVSASTLPYLIGIFGPPLASMAAALAIWMMSAYERPGCLSLSGWRFDLRALRTLRGLTIAAKATTTTRSVASA